MLPIASSTKRPQRRLTKHGVEVELQAAVPAASCPRRSADAEGSLFLHHPARPSGLRIIPAGRKRGRAET